MTVGDTEKNRKHDGKVVKKYGVAYTQHHDMMNMLV